MLESCGLFYEQYAEKVKTEDEPDIMEDFKLAATEGRIGGKSLRRYLLKTVLISHLHALLLDLLFLCPGFEEFLFTI